ncbi:hypothetical protein CMV_027819, partial [Castanea mollissima]
DYLPLGLFLGSIADEDSDVETENSNNMVNMEEFIMEKMINDLPPVDLKEPFCWQANNYAKVCASLSSSFELEILLMHR